MTVNVTYFVQEATEAAAAAAPNKLVAQLKKVMADNFLFYFKAHTFHWNVEGKDFPQYHEFFDGVYNNAFSAVDRLAEEIRALGEYAPMSLGELIDLAALYENKSQLDGLSMVRALADDNQKILGGLLATQRMADAANQVGLANYLQDLYDQHKKLAWMLSAILKV
jgi:starvation-inducible DNA-binding protein